MGNPTYPQRTPNPGNLPPDDDPAPSTGLIDVSRHQQAGPTAPAPVTPTPNAPVDVRRVPPTLPAGQADGSE